MAAARKKARKKRGKQAPKSQPPGRPRPRKGAAIPELRRVLAPTDLSELGGAAVPYAYALVARGGTVHLLHVVEPPRVPNPLYAHYTPGRVPTGAERKLQEATLRERLRALVPVAAAQRGVVTRVELDEGDAVAERVCAAAQRLGADAICLGSHGLGGFARTLFGSVTEGVLRGTRRPVLVVWSEPG